MRALIVIIGLIILIIVAGIVVYYSGVIYVGADRPENKIVSEFFSTASDRSVKYHARNIKAPPLNNPALQQLGFAHYRGMCVACHGAPGVTPLDVAAGLNPSPPDLSESAKDSRRRRYSGSPNTASE